MNIHINFYLVFYLLECTVLAREHLMETIEGVTQVDVDLELDETFVDETVPNTVTSPAPDKDKATQRSTKLKVSSGAVAATTVDEVSATKETTRSI